jgi:cell division cycle 20-like protein 1, cofactor of APC complex
LLINVCFLVFEYSSGNNNWETNYSTLTKSNENSSQSSKKQRECGESARDSFAYSCLLKNELLGTSIEDIKNVSDDKMGCLSTSNRGLFKYQQPTRQVSTIEDMSDCTTTRLITMRKSLAKILITLLADKTYVCIMDG